MEDKVKLDQLLTVSEVADKLHMHPNTLRRWSDEGRIRAYRINRRGDRRFLKGDIILFLQEMSLGQKNLTKSP